MGPSDDRPAARTSGLVVKALRDEVLIYDLAQHRAHSLNRPAAAVWRACDGTRTAGQIAALLREADLPVAPEAVRYALAELGKTRLLASPVVESGLTRRQLLARLGTGAAVPLVSSIVAPRAAQAQSCLGVGAVCGGGPPCCAGLNCCITTQPDPTCVAPGPGNCPPPP